VGAGPAGCVLAHRLSADPSTRVLLLEAGGSDRSLMYKVPKFLFFTGQSRTHAWHYQIEPFGPAAQSEDWIRGRVLGGSSSINGMVYNRGFAPDYDELSALGNPGWDWQTIVQAYKALENHELGESIIRGAGGPLDVTVEQDRDEVSEAMIEAAGRLGMTRHLDVNSSDDDRIGYAARTIKNGLRVSASTAFVRPIRARANLTVATDMPVTELLFESDAATGVRTRKGAQSIDFHASREIIVCAGSIATPQLLQLSGIGPGAVLRDAGVAVRVDSPFIGERMREHRCFPLQARLRQNIGYNRMLATRASQGVTGLRYLATRRGPLATSAFDLIAFFRALPESTRPDAQLLLAPFSRGLPFERLPVERRPGISMVGFVLRPTSEGSVRIMTADPTAPPRIEANYLATPYDRRISVAIFRRMREILGESPVAELVLSETVPGAAVDHDDDIIKAGFLYGGTGYHACGTCAMGSDETDAVDAQLRVRGVTRLRVMDASVLPTMVSGNLNAPIMAMAWHAADIIRDTA
jgi:choline dehydrogenase